MLFRSATSLAKVAIVPAHPATTARRDTSREVVATSIERMAISLVLALTAKVAKVSKRLVDTNLVKVVSTADPAQLDTILMQSTA